MEQANCVDCGKPLSHTILAAGLTRCTPCSAQRLRAGTAQSTEEMQQAWAGGKMSYCPSCGREVGDRDEFCVGCGHRLTDAGASRSFWHQFWGSWWVRAPLIVVALIFAIGIVSALLSGSDSDSEADYSLAFLEATDAVNQAGFGVADAFVAYDTCSTDEECVDALELLTSEYAVYIPILKAQISTLERLEPPTDFQGLQATYVEQLKLRVEAGELIIDGWESLDAALLEQGFTKFREAQTKVGDLLDELQALQE